MKHYLARLNEVTRNYWGSKALCDYKGDEFTYGDIARQIARFHLFFKGMGIKKGDRIAIWAKNTSRWGISFLAANTYEAVAVTLLADFHPDSINKLVNHSESRILFTEPAQWSRLDKAGMPLLEAVISSEDFSLIYAKDEKIKAAFSGMDKAFLARYPDGFTREDVHYPVDNDKELAIINYTSGTTSDPKGVMLRYECLSANVEFGADELPMVPHAKMVSMLPLAHVFGMMFDFICPTCNGVNVYFLCKAPTPAVLLGALGELKPQMIMTVPLVMEKIFKGKIQPVLNKPVMRVLTGIPGINQLIFKKIRNTLLNAFGGNMILIGMGGGPLNPEVDKWFKRIKLPYTVGYGMTEAAPLLSFASIKDFAPKSCGREIFCINLRIDSDDPQHKVGEIQAKGINIMSGYYKNKKATEAAFTEDGWLKTGDLGIIDAKGNVFIKGRSKNMLLSSNGQNIYSEEVEAVCNNQPFIQESVLVSRKGILTALVYLNPEEVKAAGLSGKALEDKMEEIRNITNRSLPNYSRISRFEIMDKPFEKTPKMSIKRFLYS